ncbi:conserved hypothetical protein [Leishmania major strain Friedlin]|uniref:Uncharacterized protein n=1 Tax=Leishmania major TaxID=5664 RepID=Q4QGS5_LEIMA|nr:conserved hypothetical protein [Leishmania major strain Friedlin]CAG9570424.1 hypothetical_protein_-_conserved [Leishmania major strain Friedlin]CAJ02448.1 conserved hypothetical protein [Leishmania major strain Friedlin]|eukprot:XP_001681623.1 conserved hypothetical protein [Leishmania major strain Friedlin]
MSDVLGYLNGVLHRVSATFMPTEMDDVASFLRGDAWVVATAASASAQQTAQTFSTAATDLSCGVARPTTVSYPLGATRWGRFIPLGIAGTTLVSAATSGSRAVLLDFFESNGFEQVFTVSLVPTEQQQQQQSHVRLAAPGTMEGAGSSGDTALSRDGHCHADLWRTQRRFSFSPSDTGDTTASRKRARSNAASSVAIDMSLDSRYSTAAEAARHACMAAARRWFEGVEERALLDADEPREGGDGGARRNHKTRLRRLLLIVRCCTDNRVAFSTRGGATGAAQVSSSGTGRRHRRGKDPLYLLLHDLAALTTLYEVRLAPTCCAARPAVLLLPEDDSYGGSMLRQQLREEVGHRYWVELFLQSDGASSGVPARHGEAGAADAGRGARKGDGWRTTLIGCSSGASGAPGGLGSVLRQRQHEQAETPLERGCRLAAQWGVLDLSAAMRSAQQSTGGEALRCSAASAFASVGVPAGGSASGHAPSSSASGPRPTGPMSAQQREEGLRRHASCFFLRPSNAPLCVFLMEALRRFPVLVRPPVLQHWQSTWTARHSLMDVLLVFHTALCPFVLSSSSVGVTAACQAPPPPSWMRGGTPFPASTMLQDTTDLLDALLCAAFALAEERDAAQPLSVNDFVIEQATLFLLLYEALVHQREGRLRRIPGVVRVLLGLSDRCASAAAKSCAVDEAAACLPRGGATTDEKVHHAVRHLLPFAPLNLFYERVAQLGAASRKGHDSRREVQPYPMNSIALPIRRMSLAPQLQHSTLLALLPLGESVWELQGVAARVWREELPARWQRVVEAVGTRDDHPRAHPSSAALRGTNDDAGASAPTQLSAGNFYHPLVPHAVRVLYLLTAHALRAPTEAAKQVPLVQLQMICQLSDEQLLLVLKELQVAGLASTNLKTKSARTLLDTV